MSGLDDRHGQRGRRGRKREQGQRQRGKCVAEIGSGHRIAVRGQVLQPGRRIGRGRLVLRDAVGNEGGAGPGHEIGQADLPGEIQGKGLVDHQQRQCAVGAAHAIGREQEIVAAAGQHGVARARKVLHQFGRVERGIRRVRGAQNAVIAAGAPSVDRGVKIAVRIRPVMQVPPQVGAKLGFHQGAHAVGEVEGVDQAGGLPAHFPRVAVVLGHAQFHVGAGGAQVVADLLAQARRRAGPIRPDGGAGIVRHLQQQRITVRRIRVVGPAPGGPLPVKMVDEKIRRDAEAAELRQHDGRPAIIRRLRARVDGKMAGVVAGGVFARHHHDAHLDGHAGIGRLHLLNISRRPRGIGVRIVRHGIGIHFPRAITFIAHFPILEAAVIGLVGVQHPGGRLGRRAGAVVDGGENLRAQVGGEIAEGGIAGGIAGPIIFVRSRAAGPPQGQVPRLLDHGQRFGIPQGVVPSGRVQSELPRVHRLQHMRGIHAQVDHRRRRRRRQFDIVHEENRLRPGRGALDPKTSAVGLVGDVEGGQGNRELAPSVGRQRCAQPVGRLIGAVQQGRDLQLLAARAAAVGPKTQARVGRGVEIRVLEIKRLPAGILHADGIGARVDRVIGLEIHRGPAPALKAVHQVVGVNRQVVLGCRRARRGIYGLVRHVGAGRVIAARINRRHEVCADGQTGDGRAGGGAAGHRVGAEGQAGGKEHHRPRGVAGRHAVGLHCEGERHGGAAHRGIDRRYQRRVGLVYEGDIVNFERVSQDGAAPL